MSTHSLYLRAAGHGLGKAAVFKEASDPLPPAADHDLLTWNTGLLGPRHGQGTITKGKTSHQSQQNKG